MPRFRFLVPCVLSLFAAASLSCSSNHRLQSITISPASADAKDFSNGQVQFTAMGNYGMMTQSAPVKVLWWNSTPWVLAPTTPPGFNIDSNGVATCTNLTGMFSLWATAPKDQSIAVSQMTQSTSQVTATAQLTCP